MILQVYGETEVIRPDGWRSSTSLVSVQAVEELLGRP